MRVFITTWLFCGISLSHAEDWPTWQHDNRRTGSTEESLNVEALNLDWTWKSSAPPQTAWAGPAKYDAYAFHRNLPSMRNYDSVFHLIAAGERVWFGSSVDDSVRCLNAGSGTPVWTFTTDGPVRLAPTWSEGKLWFGSDDGFARCVDAATGKEIWRYSPVDHGTGKHSLVLNNGRLIPFQPCRTGVVIEDGNAWFACGMLPWKDSFLCAVDAATGEQRSESHFRKKLPGRTMEGPPALSSGALILPQGRVAPRVFDRFTGEDLGEMAKSGGGSVVVVSLDDSILHGPATDSRKGGFRRSGGKTREMVAALGRGNALVVDGSQSWMLTDSSIACTDLLNDDMLWTASCNCPFSMIKAADVLFVGGDRSIAAHSAKDGRRLWSRTVDGRVFGLVAANGRLFASSDTGVIHCFSTNGSPESDSNVAQKENGKVQQIQPISDARLLGHWAFQRSSSTANQIKALTGSDLTLPDAGRFSSIGEFQCLELDGKKESAMVAPTFRDAPHPDRDVTAEAWVRIDQLQEWGGIIGIVQDNGSDEKGWILGYRKDRFSFAVNATDGEDRLSYVVADEPFALGEWNHVAGSYDGETIRLFVNGKQVAQSEEQHGNIAYPDRAWFEIGAYHDKDEYFRLKGAIHEVRLYKSALNPQEIATHYSEARNRFPETSQQIDPESGPWSRFTGADTATVRWTTRSPQPSSLEYGGKEFSRVAENPAPVTEHSVKLTNLARNQVVNYRIRTQVNGVTHYSTDFECDNFFNFSTPSPNRIPKPVDELQERQAREILSHADVARGLCLILGEVDIDLLIELCRQSQLRFIVALDDEEKVKALRDTLLTNRVYGNQVTVHKTNPSLLPFPNHWADLVVLGERSAVWSRVQVQQQVRPDGGVLLADRSIAENLSVNWIESAALINATWRKWIAPPLAGAGEWSHLYGTPNNSAFGGETLADAQSADELEVQWVGRPGPRYQADRSGRKPSPLSIGGRLFLQGFHRIIAVNAFNGTILWSLEVPGLERFNMPRDCSNWCCDRDHLLVAVKHECWKIDARTGTVLDRIPADEDAPTTLDWGYVAVTDNRLYGSAVRAGTSWTSFWGGGDEGWYDARTGAVTHPICSDSIFCRDIESGSLIWEYQRGVIANPTITISGDTMYFIECRDKDVVQSDERRISNPRFWKDLHLVAVNSKNGSPRWEKKLENLDPQVVLYLAHSADQLALVSSSNGKYKISSLHDHDGSQRWTQTTEWPGGKGDHGKAMMKPAISGDRIFLRPNVLSLADGRVLPEKMPDGHGCGTYACTADTIIYRAQTVTMWNPDTKTVSHWPRLRPDCWLSTLPANGMLLSPEGGGGCSCGSWMETSIGFIPKSAHFQNVQAHSAQ